ncbi:hypothetical protein FA041_27265 [Escherichia coli]|nr:hypothetical protein [Escherichia coli]MBW9313294.1 hypothetical protein [Escherichia coli]
MFMAMQRGHMNVIKTIFNALPTLFNTFKFDKKYEAPPRQIILMNIPVCFQRYSINNKTL